MLRQLANTRYTMGEFIASRISFRRILEIDPTDALAWQFLIPLEEMEGNRGAADIAREKYLLWRDDPQSDSIAARFFAGHPEWAEERSGAHVHEANSAPRPVLIGAHAVPEK